MKKYEHLIYEPPYQKQYEASIWKGAGSNLLRGVIIIYMKHFIHLSFTVGKHVKKSLNFDNSNLVNWKILQYFIYSLNHDYITSGS
jgi:hypothetical protein